MKWLREGNRHIIENEFFGMHCANANFQQLVLLRVGGNKKRITDTNFSYAIIDDCYFRDCVFENCNFTGVVFRNSNFHGSKFIDCNFNYAEFHRSRFDPNILDQPPAYTNLKFDFAQRLRRNFHELGEKMLENKAIDLELRATSEFLHHGWHSQDKYYRDKYVGRDRALKFFQWLRHKLLYWIWGNGESFLKLGVTFVFALIFTLILAVYAKQSSETSNLELLRKSVFLFFGAYTNLIQEWAAAIILFLRLTIFGLFISMLIKKWAFR